MGFWARWRAKRALKRAARNVKKNPNPTNAAALIDAYLNLGMLEEAYTVGKQAMELYPLSATVNSALRRMFRAKYDEQVRSLRDKIRVQPSPTAYAMLAEIYNEMGETEKTIELCREALEKFPDYEGSYLILGRIRYNRLLEEGCPHDGVEAVENFEKAVKLNNSNYKTLLRLGALYLELMMPRRAVDKLKMAQMRRPDDQEIAALLKTAQEMAPERDDDIEQHFKELCERKRAARESEILLRFSIEELNNIFSHLGELPSGYIIVAITPDGRRLASHTFRHIIDEQRVILCVKSIFESADDACKKMDIGGLRRAVFVGATIQLHMFRFDDMVVALLADAKAGTKAVSEYIDALIDKELYATT
ncbi:MAG: hypothetical protein N2234_09840 [Planctomycetota bacterium]|nr:hypothetical protein [Planctomycetota bacterium]